jgi:large subunit ribosomal protein L27
MAHTKAKGTTKLGRESAAQRLGVKIFGGAMALAGQIIIRQRGTKWHAGDGVARGSDDTLFALRDGVVTYGTKKPVAFTGNRQTRRVVSVVPAATK